MSDEAPHDLLGRHTITPLTPDRRFTIEAFDALPPAHLMTAVMEFDVTTALARIERLRNAGIRVSLFAFLVHAIATAIAEHPEINRIRHRRRIVHFEDVDVSVPVEVETPQGRFPREVVVRRAQTQTPAEIFRVLESARNRHREIGSLGDEDRWNRRLMRLILLLPRFVRQFLLRVTMGNAFTVKRRAGTTLVTSVGKFASVPGFAFTFTTGPRASAFAIGSVVEKPWVHQGEIVSRSILGFSVMLNHDLVDGGPAARFGRRLQELVESAEGLEAAT